MGKFTKDIYMQGCRLLSRITGDTSGMYQFILNPDTEEFSDIYACGNGLEFEIEDDGKYYVITIKNDTAEVVDGKLLIGSREYTSREISDIVLNTYDVINIGEYDVDEVLSICKLKKCLIDLQLEAFKNMLKNCGKNKCAADELKSQRDFLFAAIWLIEHYIELGNIEKAWSVYESIKGCGNICANMNNVKCGCNG